MIRVASALIMVFGAGLALTPAANAAPRRHHPRPVRAADPAYAAPPLTVGPQSYLDPGSVAPVGSENQYVWVISQPRNDLPDTGGLAWRYGAGTLPGPFTAPGRPVNLLDYSDYGD
jgi:hypothetical protein